MTRLQQIARKRHVCDLGLRALSAVPGHLTHMPEAFDWTRGRERRARGGLNGHTTEK